MAPAVRKKSKRVGGVRMAPRHNVKNSAKTNAKNLEKLFVFWDGCPADDKTPVSIGSVFKDQKHFFLFESAAASKDSRYSFLGWDFLWEYQVKKAPTKETLSFVGTKSFHSRYAPGAKTADIYNEKDVLKPFAAMFAQPQRENIWLGQEPVFGSEIESMGGPTGFWAFDMMALLEPKVGRPPHDPLDYPAAYFYQPRVVCVYDHLTYWLWVGIFSYDRNRASAAKVEMANIKQRLQRFKKGRESLLAKSLVERQQKSRPGKEDRFKKCDSAMSEREFLKIAEQCKEDIRAGEIYQIQISNRLSCESREDPFDIYRVLRSKNPSPYMFYFKWHGQALVGASPEMMTNMMTNMMTDTTGSQVGEKAGMTIMQRPIAGTRRRKWDPKFDGLMREELRSSEKERSEHIMLVDLARNDIGRVAAPGSVKVDELMSIESYSHVFHLVSQVSGVLADDKSPLDALVAAFPNGTVCGAPKVRSVELIYKYEKISRAFYAGCLGMIDGRGQFRSTIVIRTIFAKQGKLYTQAAAGIVYDSEPKHEWQETRNKMRACVESMTVKE